MVGDLTGCDLLIVVAAACWDWQGKRQESQKQVKQIQWQAESLLDQLQKGTQVGAG